VIQDAFGPLITVFEKILVFIHEHILGPNLSWGWAILGLTVVVRLVLFPLFVRQMKSIVSLQRHMPEMKAIQEKYKDDKQRQSEELMKFYRENNINPFASCLPLLLQFPVLISLFYMLRTDLKKHICGEELVSHYNSLPLHVRQGYHTLHVTSTAKLPSKYLSNTSCEMVAPHSAKFLFIPDLTAKATGWVLAVLLIAYVVTMVGSSLLSTATADRNQRLMAIFLPLVFTVIIIGFPAGLVVYWIATNVWTIGQGWVIRRRMPPVVAANATATAGRSGGSRGRAGPAPPASRDEGGDEQEDDAEAPANGNGDQASRGLLDRVRVAAGRGQSEETESSANENGAAAAPPPPPRRRKKRRSGRRR
ncbi:MAG TPA: YidC/Oxa1 family membrane protein insertase, partial [Solirubrobacteraceae bacterium]|nr:YidC/Oxa1 family membrane protein insertase [Solirubrobacteraceae bacterium]